MEFSAAILCLTVALFLRVRADVKAVITSWFEVSRTSGRSDASFEVENESGAKKVQDVCVVFQHDEGCEIGGKFLPLLKRRRKRCLSLNSPSKLSLHSFSSIVMLT